ncbi:MAG: sulfotransferase family protein [Rhodanobacteraceae bacterium]|nr:MAG: sulfotransferase family protein [Rhodanobacteraceae bacterium]
MPVTTTAAIVAALERNDAALAERLCREQLAGSPDAVEVLILHALSLWRLGNRPGAIAIYRSLAERYPDEPAHWRNLTNALRESGDPEAAETASAAAVRLAPDDAEWLEQHGLLQMELGKPDAARDTLLRAFGKAPDSPSVRIHAARACSACRDARAENLLRPWRTWIPMSDALQSELAEALKDQGDIDGALELLEDLAQRHPVDWRLRLRLSALYERVNRLSDAEALLVGVMASAAAAQMTPRDVREADHQRAHLAARRGDYQAARQLLEHSGPQDAHHCGHWFDLAKICDKLDDRVATMAALERAHAIQVADIRATHPQWFAPGARTLPNQNPRVTAPQYGKWPALRAPAAAQSPVFVVGFPRSGTTLLEQMLDAHPRLQSMDERPFFNMLATQLDHSLGVEIPRDLEKLDQRDCDELRKGYLILACGKVQRDWGTRLVDKNPMNMLWLPMMYRMFPAAKYILAVRHPCDVLLSCYMQNFMSSSLAVICENLKVLATAYVDAMQHWLYHVDVFKPDVFISKYEDLVADPLDQSRRITDFLELGDAEAMLGFARRAREKGYIATPSYSQVIEPINRKGIGRWQRYREYFEPVLPILRPMLEHWGYAADAMTATEC